jgi:hypothetical protein
MTQQTADQHIHHFVPVRAGTWAGEPAYKQQCACGKTPHEARAEVAR